MALAPPEELLRDRRAVAPQDSANMARRLPIRLQHDVTANLYQALPLCIILANDHMRPWFFEEYVQLFSLYSRRKYRAGIRLLDAEPEATDEESIVVNFLAWPATWLKEVALKEFFGQDPEDIQSLLVRSIELGCYVKLEVDEYYLPSKIYYGTSNFIHPTLIYGYDDRAREFYGLGYDRDLLFVALTYGYLDLQNAYASARKHHEELKAGVVTLMKPKAMRQPYPFSVQRYAAALYNYLYSRKDEARTYRLHSFLPADAEAKGHLKFGFDIYSHVERSLDRAANVRGDEVYKNLHLLYEHKRALRQGLQHLAAAMGGNGELTDLLRDFDHVVDRFQAIRITFFRNQHVEDRKAARDILNMLMQSKEEEWNVLGRIHEWLEARQV
jgi:hypothetical protein